MRDERALALELDRALAGEDAGAEALELAGQLVAETAVDGARVTRYDASSNTITIAESCRAFASGCSEVLDPIDLYRRTVDGPGSRADKTSTGWRLTIRGGGAAGVEQVVTI